MRHIIRLAGIVAAFCLATFYAAPPAGAQATRTWVSGVGDDANPCSRTAPCKTFAGAISKTAVNGEINCLDPAGFGTVTITKSIALICQYTEGGITNPSTNGITINSAGAVVFLSGLDIEGGGTGLNGINFIQGAALHVEQSKIRGNNAASTTAGSGIFFAPNSAATLYVSDTVIADNGAGSGATATGSGIMIRPGAGGSAIAVLDRVHLENNSNGISIDTRTGNASSATFTDGTISGGALGAVAVSTGATQAQLTINRSVIQNMSLFAVDASGNGAQTTVGASVITSNGQAWATQAGGVTASYSDNEVAGNTTASAPTTTLLKS